MDESRFMYAVLFADGRWRCIDRDIHGHHADGEGSLVLHDGNGDEVEAFEGVAAWTLMVPGDFYGNGPPPELVSR